MAAITDALRWLAQFPRVGAARLAADLLDTDVKGATERLLLRRLLLLRQLLKLSPASTGGGVGEGRDSRLLPLSACARFVASSYSRREARLRAVALSTVGALAEAALRASADEKRLLVGHLKVSRHHCVASRVISEGTLVRNELVGGCRMAYALGFGAGGGRSKGSEAVDPRGITTAAVSRGSKARVRDRPSLRVGREK